MKTVAKPQPEGGGGAAHLRAVLETRWRKGHLGTCARDCGTGISTLENWVTGTTTTLEPALMQELASYLLNATYDETTDLLRSARRQETQPLAPPDYPPRWDAGGRVPVALNRGGELSVGSRPVKPEPPSSSGKLARRGWAD